MAKKKPKKSEKRQPAERPPKPALWRLWPRLLFLIPVVVVLWVTFYNRIEPELGGIPFFYWYQLAWVLIAACIVMGVYLIETRITHTARAPQDRETPGPPGDVL